MPLFIVLNFLLQTEATSDDAFTGGYATAILERDFDARGKVDVRQGVLTLSEQQETGWSPNLSIRAGVEFSSSERGRRRVKLLLESYRGFGPNGQFYHERIETFGFGLHVFF
jgi:hypothetical protein